MQITTAIKSFFISTVFFSSLAQAQIPDEVVFHDTVFVNYPISGQFYHVFYILNNSTSNESKKYSWDEILQYCTPTSIKNECELNMRPIQFDIFDAYMHKFRVNKLDGSILYVGDFIYPESYKDQGTIRHLVYQFKGRDAGGKIIQSVSLLPTNTTPNTSLHIPLMTINKTSHQFFTKAQINNIPDNSNTPLSFVPVFSSVPTAFASNALYMTFFYSAVELYIYSDSYSEDQESVIGVFNSSCPDDSNRDLCRSSISNTPGSGYNISYQNRIVEINYAPPSLSVIPNQTITANKPFSLDLKNYLSKIVDGAPEVTMTVSPNDVAGLHFDANAMTLSGRPSSTGSYQFTVNAKSTLGEAAPITFMVHIGVNQGDKPEWKPMAELPGATVEVGYDFDMNRLLAHAAGAVKFTIAESFPHPEWLRIENGHLVGTPTANDAGTTQQVTLFAESPTGGSATNAQGDPEPLTLSIPIHQDGRLRPVMQSLEKRVGANESIRFDLRDLVSDPTNDPNLQIVLDKVEPLNEQLKLAINQSTVLEGLIPSDTPGQTFQLSLHAHNTQGGDSEPALVNLKVEINPMYKPTFNGAKPTLPILIPGTPFFHDFQESNDVRPERIPFTIKFAEGYPHPSWLQIENNQLKADKVPDDIFDDVDFHVVIENIPGGRSEVFHLFILAMD